VPVRRTPAIAALAAVLVVGLAPAASAAKERPVTIRKSKIVDQKGRTVILHGVNVVYKVPPYYPNPSQGERTSFNRDDVARLREWGFNTVRFGINWKALEPQRGQFDQAYIDEVVRQMKMAEQGGLYVLVDMHQDLFAEKYGGEGAPDWAVLDDSIPFVPGTPFPAPYAQPAVGRAETSLWENRDGIRTEFAKAQSMVAQRLRGAPRVLGYDLYNEPLCDLTNSECGFPPSASSVGKWLQPFYDEVVPAISKADPTHPVFYEDWVFTDFGYPANVGASPNKAWPFPRTGLSHHVYCAPPPISTASCEDQQRSAYEETAKAAARNNVAPLMTEFGATDDLSVLKSNTAAADKAGEGWQYWQYKTYFDPTTSSATGSGGADAESIVDEKGNVKKDKLKVLSRVYPKRIAGDRAQWKFDPDKETFDLSYRPQNRRRTTVISVPFTVHYPNGFTVEVSGGKLVSKKGRAPVVVRAGRRSSKVSVAIRPSS
jgi:endoglycosylceramidase